uniref:Cap-specific mRNA (nucleoside-2'-O-)-methyltransferase 1 n=1 Tax=Guillardia theta TaxID=55529 RepID=A0A7S4JDR9_GUITH
MAKMGWKEGDALGKTGQGLTQAIDVYDKQDRAGLGASSGFQRERKAGLHIQNHQKKEEISIDVYVEWVVADPDHMNPSFDALRMGYVMEQVQDCDCMGDPKASPTADYDMLATREVAQDIKDSKSAFDNMDRKLMRDAVMRANPWELCSVKGHHIFQNRAAMKMAEMDWLFNFTSRRYSNPVIDDTPSKHDNQFYFADICAGPGGFTEYMYWRRQQSARGWGFTLKGDHDFRLDKFNSTSPHYTFTPCYGQDDSGNIYNNENMRHFAAKVKKDTEGRGVVLVTADGGDSVDGEFLRQEWIMRRLALCQCCTALMILRRGGNFICKLFDIFTPFLHDLCYLMSLHFEQTALVKPLTSRPANSERYLVCKGLLQDSPQLIEFLLHINQFLDDDKLKERGNRQVSRLLPPDSVPQSWTNYVKEHNVTVGQTQIEYLKETMKFYEDPMLSISDKQVEICKKCVTKWGIPETISESRKLIYMPPGTRQPTQASEHAEDKEMFVFNPETDKPKQEAKTGARAVAPTQTKEPLAHEDAERKGASESSGKEATAPAAADDPSQRVEVKKKKVVGPDLSNDSVLAALQKRAAAATAKQLEEEEQKQKQKLEEKKERDRKLKEREESSKAGEAKKKSAKGDKPSQKATEEKVERKEREPTPPTPPPTREEEEEEMGEREEKRDRKEKKSKSKRNRSDEEEDGREKKHKKSKRDKEKGKDSDEKRDQDAGGNGGTSFKIKLKVTSKEK